MGLFGASLSFILAEKGVEFKDLGELALMGIPYVLKVLIAPIIDSVIAIVFMRINENSLNQEHMERERLFLYL